MFNYYIMKNLANCSPSRDMSIFRFELDCTSYVGKTRRCTYNTAWRVVYFSNMSPRKRKHF